MFMKLVKLALLLFILIGQAISTANDIPDGTKLYCKEVYFEMLSNNLIEKQRVNSNIRQLFIISETKIFDYNNIFSPYTITYKSKGTIDAELKGIGENGNINYYLTFYKLTDSINTLHIDDERGYVLDTDYNCSENKDEIY